MTDSASAEASDSSAVGSATVVGTSRKPFLQACAGGRPEHVPIWIMRQAGRYMPAYRELRSRYTFLELCRTPELAAQVTLQPIRELELDAAILFSDILIPLEPMGLDVDFVEGEGPRLTPRVDSLERARALREPDFEGETRFVAETLRLVRSELPPETALIGFAGAPWTLACYAVEGSGSRTFESVKRMMFGKPDTLHLLLDKLARSVARHLAQQLDAGAEAVQIFDSWAGILSPEDYLEFSLPYTRRVLDELSAYPQAKILFVKDAGAFLPHTVSVGADVLSVDWRVDLAEARNRYADVGPRVWQGNLDPLALLGEREIMLEKARRILEANADRPGYVFNLGHGITPPTPVENVRALVELVHEYPIDRVG